MSQNAAQLMVRCLEAEQVDYIFGIPGEENLNVMDALLDSTITFVATRHEQGAAFMADVYGRITGKAGVCMSTLGPGATNLITGVADANMDKAPIVAIAGQAATNRMHKESHQVVDLVSMFRPISKCATQILEPETTPEVIRKAFKLAQSEKPGACFIDFPENIAKMATHATPLPVSEPLRSGAHPEVREQALMLLQNAQRPLILAGNGIIRAHAEPQLLDFAQTFHIPVVNTFMAKGVISFKHTLAIGSAGLQSGDYHNCGFDVADVIICIGFDMAEYHPHAWHPTRDRTIIHIDSQPAEVDDAYLPAVELLGDIKRNLELLVQTTRMHSTWQHPAPQRDLSPYRYLRQSLIEEMKLHANSTAFPIKPQKIIWDLRTAMNIDDIAICDVGAHKMWMARMFRCEVSNTCIISNGMASMGIALPGVIAAKLAYPNKAAVAVTGDAGFLMNVQELETAVRLGLSLVVLIWNDSGYGLIRWKQQREFGRTSHVEFNNPDFVKLAESFGAVGIRVQAADNLLGILNTALAYQGVTVIDCPVDYSENSQLVARLGNVLD
jgi:acetolactate synthase-1/2/3 large subunit